MKGNLLKYINFNLHAFDDGAKEGTICQGSRAGKGFGLNDQVNSIPKSRIEPTSRMG